MVAWFKDLLKAVQQFEAERDRIVLEHYKRTGVLLVGYH